MPRISPRLARLPEALGGVRGSVKLNTPSTSDAAAAIKNVLRSSPSAMPCGESQSNAKLIRRPATIQPTVPQTRIFEKCRAGSSICRNEMAFTSASVGM